MRVFGMFFILVLDFRSTMPENDFSDCSVPAICKRSQYVESVWMPMSPAVYKANAGLKGDKGEVGEIGKSGPKGEKGTKSDPGSMAMTVTQELQGRIECLERYFASLYSVLGFPSVYGGKRYHMYWFCLKLLLNNQLIPHENATYPCLIGSPADLLNAEDQTLAEQIVRKSMANTAKTKIFLGMSYNVTTKTIYWSNGTALSAELAGSFRWWTTHRYPILEPTTLTALGIGVTRSGSPEDNGLFNMHSEDPTDGVLCVIDD